MSAAKLVSAEEAQKLLAGATPGPWQQGHHVDEPCAIVAVERPYYSLLGLHNDTAIVSKEGDAALMTAAPELARTVIELHEKLAQAERRAAVAKEAEQEACAADCNALACEWRDNADVAADGRDESEWAAMADGADDCALKLRARGQVSQ